MKIYVCYDLDDNGSWYSVKLFSTYRLAEEFQKKNENLVKLEISEMIVDEGIENSKPENVTCPECGGEMVSRKGQYGTFWGCRKYPNCRGTRDNMGRSKEERRAESDKERENENSQANGPNRFPFKRG